MMVMMMDGGDSQMVLAALVEVVVAGDDWCKSCGQGQRGRRRGCD